MDDKQKVILTQEQAAGEVARARKIYPVVRLLDAQEVSTDSSCLLLGEGCPCLRMVCSKVLAEGGEVCEQLRVGDEVHRGIVRYVEVDGDPHVLLMARPLSNAEDADKELLYEDVLTKVYNRRFYEDRLSETHMTAGVAVIDLDDFKMLNDTFGHHVGDLAIKAAAAAMQKSIRSTDTLVRYGGDEFVIIMPNISSTDFAVRLRDVSEAIMSSTVTGHEKLRLSASVGGVLASGQTVSQAVQRADKLMYHAKLKRGSVVTDGDMADGELLQSSKPLLLIVDDAEMNRAILTEMLKNDYDIVEADCGQAALDAIDRYGTDLALVLLDIIMPGMNGFEVLSEMTRQSIIDDVPVIMISSEDSDDVVLRAYEMGASDYVSRPFDARVVRRRVSNIIRLYAKQRRLGTLLAQQYYERVKNSQMLIDIMAGVMELRNGESGLHVTHIEKLTELLLEELVSRTDEFDIDVEERGMIAMASALHDIGKMSIDDAILNKPGRLTPEEFEIMKTHTTIGSDMLQELGRHHAHNALLMYAYQIARWHHERWDGKGYPDGLKGESIPIAAQVVSVADVYDALTSVRVYKDAIPHDEAIQMILDGKCGQFNPLLLECLLAVQDRIAETLQNPADVVLFPSL